MQREGCICLPTMSRPKAKKGGNGGTEATSKGWIAARSGWIQKSTSQIVKGVSDCAAILTTQLVSAV
jgi:hypothetical protein